jgi:hypothetical protein
MAYIISDPYLFTLLMTGIMSLVALTAYLLFYKLLQGLFAKGLKSPSKYREEIVMCGRDYEEDSISIPLSKVFTDIMKRALPKMHYEIEEHIGTRILSDWFTWMLILLVTVVILIAVFGW